MSAPVLDLRRMRWWDLDRVFEIERASFGEDPWTVTQFWSELARVPESRWYVVAQRSGRILGYAGLLLVVPEADVATVAVAPEARGSGVGTALMRALADRASAVGASRLQLEVRAENSGARALYESLGLTVDGRRRNYYGPGLDALLMSRRLAGAGTPGGS